MNQNQSRLDLYDNRWYKPGGNPLSRLIWYFVNHLFLNSALFPVSSFKVLLLRMFGAKVGEGVVIKPTVNIKYPWNLTIGNYVWIGEEVWIDNLGKVTIGDHACISQGALLLCGNHNYRKPTFDLMVGNITLENGAWVGAKSIVGPGVTLKSHAVLSAGSVAGSDLESWSVYRGNPAQLIRKRTSDEHQ
jgi:putative colanic acid biosynthesis acetyltransferase WcaF